MNILTVHNLSFFGKKKKMWHNNLREESKGPLDRQIDFGRIGELRNFSYEFTFGKAYLLDSEPDGGGWTLSWIIGGLLEQDEGVIKKNNVIYPLEERKKDSCCVRHNLGRRFLFWEETVRKQIRRGLKSARGQFFRSEEEIIRRFHLSPERLDRPLRYLSGEGWRASCAIGIASGKRIFCFPYMPSMYLEEYVQLEDIIEVLKETGALVLIPTKATEGTRKLCDEVVSITDF